MTERPSTRNLRLTSNAIASFLGFAVRAAVTFAVTPLLVHGLGDRRYGFWSLVESVLAYLSLLDLGILTALVRHAARFEAQEDWEDLNRTVNTSLALYSGLGTVAFATTAALALGWSRPLGAPPDLAGEIRALLLLLGANLALRFPLTALAALLDSLGQYPVKTAIRTVWSLAGSAVLVWSVNSGHGLVAVGVVVTACGLGEGVTSGLASWYFLPQLRLSWRYVDRATFRMIFAFSMYSFLAMIAGRISFQTDAMVIGTLLTPQHVTYFTLGPRMVEFAKEPFRTISLPFMPAISSFQAAGNRAAIHRLFVDGTRVLLLAAIPLQVGLTVLGRPFLSIWMGPDYVAPSFPVLLALSVTVALAVNQMMAVKVIYGTGDLRFFTLIVVLEGAANLALSVLMARPLGILGVALGTTVPNVVGSMVVIVRVCRMLDLRPLEYLKAVWLRPLLLGCRLALFWLGLLRLVPVTSWTRFLVVGSLGTAAYAISALWTEFGLARIRGWLDGTASPSP